MATDVLLYGHFVASKAGKTGLADVTVDIDKIEKATGTRTAVVTAGAATEGRRGYYYYRLAAATPLTHDYVGIFMTADATVDQQHVAAVRPDLAEGWAAVFAYLDAAISTRLASASYTAAPDVDDVWDEIVTGTTTARSALASAGSAADPLLNAVPGSYAQGTAGAALGRIGNGDITAVSPIATNGDIAIDIGYDHMAADNRAFSWTDTNGSWVDLTGATAKLIIAGLLEADCTITNPGTSAQGVQCELTRTQTATLVPGARAFVVDVVRGGHLLKQISAYATMTAKVTA